MLENLTPRVRYILYLVPAWFAFLFLLAMYGRYSLDIPYYDQWELVPLLEKQSLGALGFRDFWGQHNEHRLIFPRLLMLALAQWSQWNVYWELATNFVLALTTWASLALLIRRTGRQIHEEDNGPVYMVMSLIVFSLSQWQNWFLGWQMQVFMTVLAIILSLACLSFQRYTSLGVALAAVFGVLATYSFANGILIWPIGFLLLVLLRHTRPRFWRQELGAWGGVGLTVIASYLYGYETPAYHPSLLEALRQPLHSALYLLAYLGQPMGNVHLILSVCMGALALLVWGVTLAQLLACRVSLNALAPWIGLALYALGTAAMTAFGRVDEGLEQALSSRYVTVANPLWVAVVVQLYWVAKVSDGWIIRRLLPAKLVLLCLALCVSSLYGAYRWTERYNAYADLRTQVLLGNDLERLRMLYPPRPQVIIERREFLRAHGLSIFGGTPQ